MRIIGYLKMDFLLILGGECLNKSFNASIGGIPVLITTPSLPTEESFENPLIAPASSKPIKGRINWGRQIGWPDGESEVDCFLIEIDCDFSEIEKIGKTIKHNIDNWILLFKENLYGYGYVFDALYIREENSIQNLYDFYYKSSDDNASATNLFEKNPGLIHIYTQTGVKLTDFEDVLKVTSENKRIKVEYQLLREAQAALLHCNYRKSILDCASALEVSLTNAIKRRIADKIIDSALLLKFLSKYNSIKLKVDLLKEFGVRLPSTEIDHNVEKPRNSVIHAGKFVSVNEAKKAFETAKAIVNLLSEEKFELCNIN